MFILFKSIYEKLHFLKKRIQTCENITHKKIATTWSKKKLGCMEQHGVKKSETREVIEQHF